MTRPSKKLGEKRYGPFEVLSKEGLMAYRLKLPVTWKKIHLVFNEALLTPYKPPIIIEGDKEYEVDEILDSRMRNSKLQYLVCWKDYPTRIDWTWEPESNIMHAPEAIKDFHTKIHWPPDDSLSIPELFYSTISRTITSLSTSHDKCEVQPEESSTGKMESSNNITVIGTLTLRRG